MTPPMIRRIAKYGRSVGKRSDFTWRYLLNLRPTVSYSIGSKTLSPEATRVVNALNRDGVAISSVEALLSGGSNQFAELEHAVAQRERDIAAQITDFKRAMKDGTQSAQKSYVMGLLPEHGMLEPRDLYTRFAMQDPIPHIANAYYGMYVSLKHRNIWHNFVTDQPPSQSQLWHQDPEDRHILKVFVYLTDVGLGSGPLVYAAGSHPKQPLPIMPEFSHKDGDTPRSNDVQMAAVVPPERWVTCTGAKGTVVFADTRGFHKGGLAREHDRILYVCEFLSRAAGGGGVSTASVGRSGSARR